MVIGLMAGWIMAITATTAQGAEPGARRVRIVIHGGAGAIRREAMTPELEKEYREKLSEALGAGYAVLKKHGSSLDAVEAAIRIMEDSPLFNAGKGAVFTHEGANELDASIMEGRTLKAGAVAAVKHVKNPIALARRVMERSPHVMLIGEGAEAFAKTQGIELVGPDYFFTQRRWDELQKALKTEKDGEKMPGEGSGGERHGTVGCVALDEHGNLAAGTSTGGMTNKRFGRVGDSPVIGAGTYASNATCAVSCTGHGEFFIRTVAAYSVAARMELGGMKVGEAAAAVIGKIGKLGGDGGLIALDREGNFALPFNTQGMYRGYVDDAGRPVVAIYGE